MVHPCPNWAKLQHAAGDGVVQGLEACDDGNAINTDACTDQCALARCGDSFVQEGEACDDGNISDRDACTNACVVATCGDGIWRRDLLFDGEAGFERCDDGNGNENDSCTSLCAPPRCGDGLQQENEGCDDGNTVETDACLNTCVVARCGDGLIQQGVEQCDGSEDCTDNCILMTCGNGAVEGTEACDDGNDVLTDACQNCLVARCGDGVMRTDLSSNESGYEACDDGNEEPGDECSVECLIDDHGNSLSTATPLSIPPGLETLVEVMRSAAINDALDKDFFSLTVEHAGVYRFDVDALDEGDPACRLFLSDGSVAGYQADRSTQEDSEDSGCSVDLYFAVGATAYLEVIKQNGALFTYGIKLQKPCGNGLVDAGEECDPASPDSNAFRCRRDCRNRRMISLAGTTGCAVVNGGVKCWGSNAGLVLGRTVEGAQQCPKLGYDLVTGQVAEYDVDVAPFVVDVIDTRHRVRDLSGGWNEALCALYGSDDVIHCWGRHRIEQTLRCLFYPDHDDMWRRPYPYTCHDNSSLGRCQDDRDIDLGWIEVPVEERAYRWENGRRVDRSDHGVRYIAGACLPAPLPYANTRPDFERGAFGAFENIQGISVGAHNKCSVERRNNGTLTKCWGKILNGVGGEETGNVCQSGDTPEERAIECHRNYRGSPETVRFGESQHVEYLDIGSETACAILRSGRISCWGRNDFGQTGSERSEASGPCVVAACEPTPFLVPVNMGVAVGVSVGGFHVCAVNQRGQLYCWGRNDRDQTGLPSDEQLCAEDTPCVRQATQVPDLPPIISVAAGRSHTCALDHVGGVLCWGDNQKGQLGVGAVGALEPGGAAKSSVALSVGRLEPMTNLTAGEFSNCARSATERVYCWGDNSLGQLGDGNCTDAVPSPMQVDFGF